MAYTLDGTDLGEVQTLGDNYESGVTPITAALGDSEKTEAIKVINAIESFPITGIITGNTATLRAFRVSFRAWMAGSGSENESPNKITFHSDIDDANFNVVVMTGSNTYVNGSPEKIEYRLELLRVTT